MVVNTIFFCHLLIEMLFHSSIHSFICKCRCIISIESTSKEFCKTNANPFWYALVRLVVCVCNFNKLLFYCSFSDEKPQNTLWYKSRILAMRHSVQRETMYTNLACAHIEFCHLAYNNLYTKETKLYAVSSVSASLLSQFNCFSVARKTTTSHIVNE